MEAIFLEIIIVIQTWIHTNWRTTGAPAARIEMRFSGSLSLVAGLCANIENSNYQPKQGGLDRLGGRKI
jgi:hypothetical protein